jgi:amino acid permease
VEQYFGNLHLKTRLPLSYHHRNSTMADWGSMFEDTAEEEPNAAWVYFTRAGRLQLKPGTYLSKLSAYAVTLNYVLGLGCLGIPYAFYQAGLSFSIVITFVAAFLSMLATMWIVEVHMRAMLVETGRRHDRSWSENIQHQQQHEHSLPPSSVADVTNDDDDPTQPLHQSKYSSYFTTQIVNMPSSSIITSEEDQSIFKSGKNSFKSPSTAKQLTELLTSPHFFASTESPVIEVASLVKGVLGKPFEVVYMICLSGLAITGLWAYSNVAANSMVQQVRFWPCAEPNFLGHCGWEYMINCAIFGIIVVPLSLLDTTEQAVIQTVFTVLRFVTLGAMAIGAVVGIFNFPEASAYLPPRMDAEPTTMHNLTTSFVSSPSLSPSPSPSNNHQVGPPYFGNGVHWSIQTSGMGILISSMCFSMLFQHSVPGLMAAIDPHQRQGVKQVFGAALLSTALLYIVLGVTMALYFGSSILPSSNLNFVQFNFGMNANWNVLASILSYVIVLFPVVGSISVYPLITLTLSNNLLVSTSQCTGWKQDDKKAIIIWRLIAGIPPILLSLLVRNLSTIIQFSGIFAVPIAYLFPALLQLYSKRGVEEGLQHLPKEFSWHFNRYRFYPLCMMFVGFGCWVLVVTQLIQHLTKL